MINGTRRRYGWSRNLKDTKTEKLWIENLLKKYSGHHQFNFLVSQ